MPATDPAQTDYARVYNEYWSRPDRFGSHSFTDADALAEQVLSVCGPGPVLDVGCGMGLLVHTLLGRGIDARGVDVSARAVAEAERSAPGRFVAGSVLDLPFTDGEFESVVSTDVLEHVAEADVPRALAELARVSRRNVFVRLATTPDRDNRWHLTVRDRAWWEAAFIAAGMRKHPLTPSVLAYDALDREGWQITLAMEKAPATGRSVGTASEDILRRSGRASEAAIARYALVCPYIRPGDVVIDAGCAGAGGTAVLACGSSAARVIGVDADAGAIEYARANYGDIGPRVEFRSAAAVDFSGFADRSADVVACFTVPEPEEELAALLRELSRVLTPGGRMILGFGGAGSSPPDGALWRAIDAMDGTVLLEKLFAQTGERDPEGSVTPSTRSVREVEFRGVVGGVTVKDPPANTERWVLVGMRSPLGANKEGYRESAFADGRDLEGFHLTDFARDYDNPWLVRSMVTIGFRATRPELVEYLAKETLKSCRAGSADEGAALCVLGYQVLGRLEASGANSLLARMARYQQDADGAAHAWRWRISNEYVAGRILERLGRRDEAVGAYLRCAAMDVMRFSPLLASKTIDAWFRAGVIRQGDGTPGAARECWVRGLNEVRRVLQGSWTNIWGRADAPVTFGMPEVSLLADLGGRCAFAIDALDRLGAGAGLAWAAAHTRTHADVRRWAERLSAAKSWLEQQAAGSAAHAAWQADRAAGLERALAWAEEQRTSWMASTHERERTIEEFKRQIADLSDAKRWLEEQVRSWEASHHQQEATILELKGWTEKLEEGKRWLDEMRTTAEERLREAQAQAAERAVERDAQTRMAEDARRTALELAAQNRQIEEARAWLDAERRALQAKVDEAERRLNELGASLPTGVTNTEATSAGAAKTDFFS